MKLTPKQRDILRHAAAGNGTITKQEAVELVGDRYANNEFHVGNVLSRMVKRGLLVRARPGVFQLPKPEKEQLTLKFEL